MTLPLNVDIGDMLLCPVCLSVFEGRILQCSQGHAVCEQCRTRLNECPSCRAPFTGTRNYLLEGLISKLNKNKSGNKKVASVKEPSTTAVVQSTNEAPPNADTSTEEVPARELHIGGLVELLADLDYDESAFELAAANQPPAPVQGKGLYFCRMLNCAVQLPICRMLNHLRYWHKNSLVEVNLEEMSGNNDFEVVGKTLSGQQPSRLAYQLPKFGLFFIIFDVKKLPTGQSMYWAWIQCVCPNRAAREFRFTLELILNNAKITYSDFVYGAQSDEAYIKEKKQCLNYEFRGHNLPSRVSLNFTIGRTVGERSVPRHSNSRVIPIVQSIQDNVLGAAAANPPNRRRRNRNRNRNQ